jgi:hypothetical protein
VSPALAPMALGATGRVIRDQRHTAVDVLAWLAVVCGCENAGPQLIGPVNFHAGQVSNPEQNAMVGFPPTSQYLLAATSKAASGSSLLSICSSRSIVDSFILSLPSGLRNPGRRFNYGRGPG